MPYTFRVVFSGLCYHHLPPEPSKNKDEEKRSEQDRFDPAVLLVNATEPRTSIDRRTHLHRHVPTMTFDPGALDDYTVDVASFETDFRLIPTGGGPQDDKTSYQDNLALLDLQNKLIHLELDEEDMSSRELQCVRHLASRKRLPEVPGKDEEHDLYWVPSLKEIDRRIERLKSQCFDDIVGNPLVACRVSLTHGNLKVERVGKVSNRYLLWDFFPNAYPGRKNGNGEWSPIQQALSDQVVLELKSLEHPIRVRYEGDREGALTFPRVIPQKLRPGEDEPVVTIHVANLPSLLDLPDTEVVTHFRWFYELVEWKNGLPSDLPAPRPATRGLRLAAGGNSLCPQGGG